jgi:hypothetical protein
MRCCEVIPIGSILVFILPININKKWDAPLPPDSVQRLLNSPSGRIELDELVKQLESEIQDTSQGMDFLSSYFNESDIIGQHQPRNQILFTELGFT